MNLESGHETTGGRWIIWAGVITLLMGAMFYLYAVYPQQGIGPQQPIYFSHRVHAGVKQINCRFCHPFVDRSENAGIPPLEKCFFCHEYIIPQHPQIVNEKQHYKNKVPVPWVRIFYVPDYVKFRHQPHIIFGKLDCSECHGRVATFDRLKPVNFEMGFCIGCHKRKNAQIDCWLACHH
ncbi:MAG TPA: cytochrome c family protein [Syntrophobacteraceae bacterium]|nr:cytochrome c family protein [Syntrophobacteraceae bacterium]